MAMTIPRSNHEMAAIVEKGIIIAAQFGYGKGCMYMHQHNVPMDVALRVLSRPDQRRNYDWQEANVFPPVTDGYGLWPDARLSVRSVA